MSVYFLFLRPNVVKYFDSLQSNERKRCYKTIKNLEHNPYTSRSGCDIKKIIGKRRIAYRLRVGNHRFLYIVKEKEVFVVEGFRRGRG